MSKFISKLAIIFSICLTLTVSFTGPALALGGTQPEIDQPAPEFTLPTNNETQEKNISLADLF